MLTEKQLANATDKTPARIRQLAPQIAKAGLATPPSGWQFEEAAIGFVKNMQRKKIGTVKERIHADLIASGIKHPQIWKGFSPRTNKTGWHFCEFGSSEDIYIGRSWKEYKAREMIGGQNGK